jgi:MFS family permease
VSLANKIQRLGSGTRPRPDERGRLGAARAALCAVFAAHGFIYASWAVRVPAIKEQTGASAAALGLALLGLSAGAVATMLIAGSLCRRFASHRVAVISCALLSVTLVLPALARSAATLGLALLVFGAAYGCLNVAMNSIAVELVAALRRPVMPGFHAAWSFGGLAGAGLGGLLAPHLSPVRDFMLVGLAGLLVTAVAGRTLLNAVPERADPPTPVGSPGAPVPADRKIPAWRRAKGTARVVGVFGLIALCAAYDEGAIGDWGALHLRQDLGAGAGLAAAGYAAFALAEATGRLSGTSLLERLGRTRVLVTGGVTACAGMLLASLAPDVWLALAGFAATGLGLANLFPAAIARAGVAAGSDGVALTSMLGYSGFLLGPPAIGFLATEFGLRAGLTTLSFLALAAAAIAYASRDTGSGRAETIDDSLSLPGTARCGRPARRAAQRGRAGAGAADRAAAGGRAVFRYLPRAAAAGRPDRQTDRGEPARGPGPGVRPGRGLPAVGPRPGRRAGLLREPYRRILGGRARRGSETGRRRARTVRPARRRSERRVRAGRDPQLSHRLAGQPGSGRAALALDGG